MSASERILVVDDDAAIGEVLVGLLQQAGFEGGWVESGEAALEALDRRHFDVVLSDVKMPGLDGMQLLDRIVEQRPDVPVVLITAHGSVPLAVEAMKRGAADFLLKPFERDEILFVVRKALTTVERRADVPERPVSKTLIGDSAAMKKVHDLIRRAARGNSTVLVRGESGTGKELVARALHDASERSSGPFVKLHCAALPESLLESELFGYEKGAFTGAGACKPGRIELAHGGTLFLDEIGDIPLSMQVKLLRVIQEHELERLGGRKTLHFDVRVIAATHRDLETLVAKGQFREDLFYRLNVVPLWLPPLRERKGDIAVLAQHFCAVHARANRRPDMAFDEDALAILVDRPWFGNVRQLENFVERLVVLGDGPRIRAADVRHELNDERQAATEEPHRPEPTEQTDFTLGTRQRRTERDALSTALKQAGNNRTLAARLLGVSRRTLYSKLEEHGLL